MLNLQNFKQLEISDKIILKKYFELFPPPHSDYSFVTMVCWQDYMKYFYTIIEDSLIIYTKKDDKIQLRLALGNPKPELDRQIMKLALENCTDPPIGVIDVNAKSRISKIFPELKFEPHRDFFDYVYLAKDLETLAGKKYMKLRNLTNRFRKQYEYEVELIQEDNLGDVKKFLRRWCLWKDCDKIPLLKSEKKAILFCVNNFIDLNLSGISIRIDGNIEAVSIFDSLSINTSVVHFEKAIPDFDGLYQVINQETAKLLTKEYLYINREADMGFAGLRLAKEKYHPHHMVEVYHVRRSELEKLKI